MRTFLFALKHPVIAFDRVGEVKSGSLNISTDAVRFSTNNLGLNENAAHEGSQVNAFRHALWQAQITKELGMDVAKEIGSIHEENPKAIDGIKDFSKVRFSTLNEADQSIDLLNNIIGRSIGSKSESYYMDNNAIAVLNYYHDNGLWIARKMSDGTYMIYQQKLSDDQYKVALERLEQLDENGFAKGQGDKIYEKEQYGNY